MWSCGKKPLSDNFANLLQTNEYTVLMFVAPDCPLCITLSTPFTELSDNFSDIQFLVVHSGMHYDAMEINMYATSTKLKPRIYRDYDYQVANHLGASVTPEFFVVDRFSNILYQGLMDDRIVELGSYKQKWENHYLRDAIQALLANKPVKVKKTKPVGCVLEY